MSVSPSVVSGPFAGDVSPSAPTGTSAPLVLLIEDEEMVADVVERLLVRLGKRVLRARDGTEGAQMFAEYKSDIALIMLDCCLPDIDGTALCRVIRQHAPNLPVILTSGWEHPEVQVLSTQGPTVFLPKPFFPAQIEAQISALLQATA